MTSEPNHNPLPKRWKIQSEYPEYINDSLSDYNAFMRQLLFNRGITDNHAAAHFIAGTVDHPTDPFLIKDMDLAVERLHQAIIQNETIVVYGDYDADGVTSSALVKLFLDALGVQARVYIPNRYDEGYGLNDDAIRELAQEGTNLIITVDCGVRAIKEISLANELGVDVVVSDHHNPGSELPPAVAVIDPKQEGDFYPEKLLAGVGLAYKLTQAYLERWPKEGVDADDWLDLVAIGTVADLAPLRGENRMLVKKGLAKIQTAPRQGVYSLAQVAGIDYRKCDASNIGFGLGPRLNAAGRLESALMAFELLTTDDPNVAGELAQKLESYNNERQDMTHEIRKEAAQRVLDADPDAVLFFAADPNFSEGVVGLAASRLTEAFYRPAIIGHRGDEVTVASCRSIPEFHITQALDACSDLLVRHGGHAAAAGFTVRNEHCDTLVDRLTAIAQEQLSEVILEPELIIDRENKLEHLGGKFIPGILEDLHQLEPTGRGNPEPIFVSRDVAVRYARCVGKEGSHLKLTLQAGRNIFDGIAFRQGYWMAVMPERVDIAYRIEMNEFNGRSTLQLNIKDIKPAGSGE
ncbi:MAG: single-stranded-DNA-specific exonuclease RecJ [Brevefilum sp.]|nr:single-stranded-DNA-specific exonuclease RecJ [Brevefilum sp.]MDT8381733.1 single-stranded-DNA-specific exonuclease RecJ [Brevefilum sp.]MDW7754050.1 single-stranded-DNA-specific exonuclease RecJ [Brevefilum sp.]